MKKIVLAFCFIFSALLVNSQTLPASYTNTNVVTGIRYPADFDWTPDGRYIVTQKGDNSFPAANAFIKIYSSTGVSLGTFFDLTDSVDSDFERGLLGIAVDPDFAVNHYVYAYYNYRNPAETILAMRVVRFTEVANVGTSPTIILNIVYATSPTTYGGNHFGGIIRFRPSEPTKLYIQTGDLAYQQTNPTLNFANKLTNPYGKILRINTDGTIPTDNPFYDDGNPATGNDDRIWSYGHRNMFGMCFNPVTDSMYSSENGLNAWDEFNIIHKGKHYGWANCEGFYNNSSTSVLCTTPGTVLPLEDWGTPLPAVTGCVYYSGGVMPEFNNHILVTDNDYGRVYDLTLGNAPNYDIVTSRTTFFDNSPAGTGGGLLAVKQGADGCLYFLRGGYTLSGYIFKVCPLGLGVDANAKSENTIGQNYPNPSTGKTQIDYSLEQNSFVTIELFDVTGRKIRTVLNTDVVAGKHTLDLADLSALKDGSYFYKMEVKQKNKVVFTETKRMMIVK
ncbi:MAG: PQQ-dependent sugar dehydrogenase [Bacteroidota bacterium]|nr:PQQ-dependent sugar dehydrogenase [Bacteroidota bacterium]